MPRPKPLDLIDTAPERSVSFAPPDQATVATGGHARRRPVPVGPGRMALGAPALLGGASRDGVTGYPIQAGKVQRPPLREETLARHRLLDWLDVKIHNRVVFVVAEAGYGKTTLLADFSRRTRLRTLWYRMDDEDRSWVSFLSYLVAAGRVHDPEFAPRTASLLEETGPGGASRDEVTDAFLGELPTIAADGAALVLDDFHVADDVADIRHIARQLVERGPERLTIVFSSRRSPGVPVARLRALGELAELRTTDLRFSDDETAALFEESYRHPLEPDVLADLTKRTEGWAASLYLVQAALRDRSAHDTRTFVRRLSGAHAELYDYLAEEVVGELPEEHQQFLMATSILQSVDPVIAEVVSQTPVATAKRLIEDLERSGLLSQRHDRTKKQHAYHPLVRQFLEARLRRDLGDLHAEELHRRVALWAEPHDWRTGCFHYASIGEAERLHGVIDRSIGSIIGAGEFALAASYLARVTSPTATQGSEIVQSRVWRHTGDLARSLLHAHQAVQMAPTSDDALGNLLSTHIAAGEFGLAAELASRLASDAGSALLRRISTATALLLKSSVDGDLNDAIQLCREIADESRALDHAHYEGIALLNCALMRLAQADGQGALEYATGAFDALSRSSSGPEVTSAQLAQAWAVAHLGRVEDSRRILDSAAAQATRYSRREWLLEAARIETWYGNESRAKSLLDELFDLGSGAPPTPTAQLTAAQLALRRGDNAAARSAIEDSNWSGPTEEPGFQARRRAASAHLSFAMGLPDAQRQLIEARRFADAQGAEMWAGYCQILSAIDRGRSTEGPIRLELISPVFLSLNAEAVAANLHLLDSASLDITAKEVRARPDRWRHAVRRAAHDPQAKSRILAARLLDEIGEPSDVALLRSIGRTMKRSPADGSLGRGLARRLAPRVWIEDQGRVEIHIGGKGISGAELRRKVLALLCFLLTRPKASGTRDEILDALWPEAAPEVALNSLNQTVYFLRRVFEPGYREDISAGYVNHEADVLWLDPTLIQSRSQACRDLLDGIQSISTPAEVDRLSELYKGPFALDFMYEEWAAPFRDALHVRYLQVIESAVTRDIESGHHDRALRIARRALDIDPEQESLELSVLRLYRLTGAHAAAAEQYAHYAAYLRDELGLEAPPLTAI